MLTVSTVLVASGQTTLYTTANDFAQFASWWNGSPGGITSSLYYSVASNMNGIGNTTAPGETGTFGSLQVTNQNWGNPNGSYAPTLPFPDVALAAIAPGSSWATGVTASSGTISFDLYAPVAFTGSYQSFGFSIYYYNNDWSTAQAANFATGSYTTFTGDDGNTWRHYNVPYTTAASVPGQLQGFELGVFMNNDPVDNGKLVYIANIQALATPVPEPTTMALAAMGGAALLSLRRRTMR